MKLCDMLEILRRLDQNFEIRSVYETAVGVVVNAIPAQESFQVCAGTEMKILIATQHESEPYDDYDCGW
jgi:hypothetical protein